MQSLEGLHPDAAHQRQPLDAQAGDAGQRRPRLRRLVRRRIDLLDPAALRSGTIAFAPDGLLAGRDEIAAARLGRLKARQRNVAATNRMVGCTDAANGVVPQAVADDAEIGFWDAVSVGGVHTVEAAVAD